MDIPLIGGAVLEIKGRRSVFFFIERKNYIYIYIRMYIIGQNMNIKYIFQVNILFILNYLVSICTLILSIEKKFIKPELEIYLFFLLYFKVFILYFIFAWGRERLLNVTDTSPKYTLILTLNWTIKRSALKRIVVMHDIVFRGVLHFIDTNLFVWSTLLYASN